LTTRSVAAPLVAALGLAASDVAAARIYVGFPYSTLSISPTVDGMPTQGLETSVYVDRTGIAAAGGRLDLPTPGDVYPLRTAKQAFDELSNGPRPLVEPYCGPIPGQSGSPPRANVASAPCPSPVPIRVTGARIGLLLTFDASSVTQSPGTPIVVPAWFFTVADNGLGPALIAIDPSILAPPEQPQPVNATAVTGGQPGPGSFSSAGPSPTSVHS
jgi:hypothetical protein